MKRVTERLLRVLVKTNLTEEQVLVAIQTAETQSDAPREKRKYQRRDMAAEQ